MEQAGQSILDAVRGRGSLFSHVPLLSCWQSTWAFGRTGAKDAIAGGCESTFTGWRCLYGVARPRCKGSVASTLTGPASALGLGGDFSLEVPRHPGSFRPSISGRYATLPASKSFPGGRDYLGHPLQGIAIPVVGHPCRRGRLEFVLRTSDGGNRYAPMARRAARSSESLLPVHVSAAPLAGWLRLRTIVAALQQRLLAGEE